MLKWHENVNLWEEEEPRRTRMAQQPDQSSASSQTSNSSLWDSDFAHPPLSSPSQSNQPTNGLDKNISGQLVHGSINQSASDHHPGREHRGVGPDQQLWAGVPCSAWLFHWSCPILNLCSNQQPNGALQPLHLASFYWFSGGKIWGVTLWLKSILQAGWNSHSHLL